MQIIDPTNTGYVAECRRSGTWKCAGQVPHTYQKRLTKETYKYRKRRINTKRDVSTPKETYQHQKRPISAKRDVSTPKETKLQ